MNLNDCLLLAIFEIYQVRTKHAGLERRPGILHCVQAIDPSFAITPKPLMSKTGETLCEGFKWLCKLFETDGQKNSFIGFITEINSQQNF